jgi:hypothetical protein
MPTHSGRGRRLPPISEVEELQFLIVICNVKKENKNTPMGWKT